MKIRVLSCAEREFAEVVELYNRERLGLGYELGPAAGEVGVSGSEPHRNRRNSLGFVPHPNLPGLSSRGFDVITCWICGNPALSAEHRIKKADMVRAYGRGPYDPSIAPLHFRNGRHSTIQGPNSRTLKYPKNLCESCNTEFSQPFDRAYDRFVTWVMENEARVVRQRFIRFSEVYASDWEIGQLDLFKYFVKSFGCRLAYTGYEVPRDAVDILYRQHFRTALRMTMSVDEDALLLPRCGLGFIGKGSLHGSTLPGGGDPAHAFWWSENFSWLNVHYWYNCVTDPTKGSEWIANTECVYLGSIASFNEETRENLRRHRDYADSS